MRNTQEPASLWLPVDDTDRKILRELRQDGRATNAEVGKRLGLTEGAVRHRVTRLRDEGTILRFTAVTRPLGPEGLVLIRCQPGKTGRILEQIKSLAIDIFECSGEYDIGAFVERETMEELNGALDTIRDLKGVDGTLTLIRMTRWVRPSSEARVLPTAGSSKAKSTSR